MEYKPTSWLFSEVELLGWVWPPEDYEELVSRLEAGDLNAEDIERLARMALAKYLRNDKRIFPVEIRALNELRKLDKLTPEQQEQFFDRLVDVESQAKSLASANEGVPLRIDIMPQSDWSSCGLWCAVEITTRSSLIRQPAIRVGRSSYMHSDEIEASLSPVPTGPLVLQGPTFIVWQAKADVRKTGKQNLTCDVKIDYLDRRPTGDSASQPIHTVTKQLSVTSEVVADHSSVAVKTLTDPKLSPEVLGPGSGGGRLSHSSRRWQVACYLFDVARGSQGNMLRTYVHVYNTHIGCAFDATVNIEGMSYDVGTICQPKGQSLEWVLQAPYPPSEPETISLTLTPNQKLASDSADLPEIWGKTIEFKGIPRNRPVILKPHVIEYSVP